MNTLINRLRENLEMSYCLQLRHEAANEIERLTKELAALKQQEKEWRELAADWRAREALAVARLAAPKPEDV